MASTLGPGRRCRFPAGPMSRSASSLASVSAVFVRFLAEGDGSAADEGCAAPAAGTTLAGLRLFSCAMAAAPLGRGIGRALSSFVAGGTGVMDWRGVGEMNRRGWLSCCGQS